MKRDMDLVRLILLEMEKNKDESYFSISIPGYSENILNNHIELLVEAGLVKANILRASPRKIVDVKLQRITWEGYDFLDSMKNEKIWEKTKELIKNKGGSISFEVLKSILLKVSKEIFI